GQNVSVYIKSILPEKMKIKLAVVEAFDEYGAKPELKYFVSKSHISSWNYSPPNADKIIQTVF
ncbi:MAG: 30S ribosomal protein S1, partial [Eubacterium sp.]|nr:30S ribosomal protein S1 [Eubacterium sp.]